MATSNQSDMSTPILPDWLFNIPDDSPTSSIVTDDPSIAIGRACRLLRLPGELRNRIWDMVVDSGSPEACELLTYLGSSYIDRLDLPPALASTCTQIKQEVYSIFLGSHHFILKSYSPHFSADTWIRLCSGQLKSLRGIEGRLQVKETNKAHSYYVNVHVSCGSKLEVTALTMPPENCTCMLTQHAEEVEAGSIDSDDPPAISFFTSLMGRTLGRKEANLGSRCGVCGKFNVALVYGG